MILTMDRQRTFFPRASLAVHEGRIVALGPEVNCTASQVVSLPHGLVMPGLINCHTHETLTRGICEDLALEEWLRSICFPLDAAYTEEIMRLSAAMNQLEMIRGGTTTFVDIYRFPQVCAQVVVQSGLRAILSPQVIDEPPGVGETLESNLALFETWHGRANGRLRVWFGVHAPYSNYVETYCRAKELARERGVGLHTHLAETDREVKLCREKFGLTPIGLMQHLGVLDEMTLCAHCVHVTPEDIEILARSGAVVVYNPTSNMKLASGIAPVETMLKVGARVVLGTDSNLSNNNLDMFEEMRMGGLLQKLASGNAAALSCYELLEMATIKGAEALGIGAEIGSLEIGKKADIIIVDFNRPHLWPYFCNDHNNLVEHLVYSACAGDVVTTIVEGKILMEQGQVQTLDQESLWVEIQKAAMWLCQRAGISKPGLLCRVGKGLPDGSA